MLFFSRHAPIPQDTQCLIITCHPADSLFNGIKQVCTLLKEKKYFYVHDWDSHKLKLTAYPALSAVILSGYGKQQQAGLTGAKSLVPSALELPPSSQLYLISGYQGRAKLLADWARKTGLAPAQIFACDEEVEVLLSTLFFIMLNELGLASLPAAFERWRYANRYLKPFFPLIREIYKKSGYNFLAALEETRKIINLDAIGELVNPGKNYHSFLSGLY